MRMLMFNENMPSSISQVAIIFLIGAVACLSILNIYRGVVPEPRFFILSLVGFALFLIAKISMLRKGKMVSFGSKKMSAPATNLYKIGYWLMIVGVLSTFFGPNT